MRTATSINFDSVLSSASKHTSELRGDAHLFVGMKDVGMANSLNSVLDEIRTLWLKLIAQLVLVEKHFDLVDAGPRHF
jgi:hypothetical protein